MNGNESKLAVYLGKKLIAYLSLHQDQLLWQYTEEWKAKGFAVSPHLPLSNEISAINTNRFLRNMLPEGSAFDELLQNVRVTRSNTFALMRALGLDTPGALVLRQSEQDLPKKSSFRSITEKELISRLNNRETQGLIIWDKKPRLSVAGIQDKLNLVVKSKGQIGFGEGSLCSTHILKFEKQTRTHLVINEYLTMKLAKHCGLNVADVTLHQFGKHMALLVERFDRKSISDTEVKRRHIIDSCQALNLPPENKYERNFGSGRDVAHIRDGVSFSLLFDFANHCQNPALTKQQIVDWALFNLLVDNHDAHGKNISFYVSSKGISLAPFYDLVNIRLYPDLDHELAMAFGDEFDSNNINAYQIAAFAESCQLSPAFIAKRLKRMIEKVTNALPQEMKKIRIEYDYPSWFNQYQKMIKLRCKHFTMQYPRITKIIL
jgi:serine/threonine-protein kinase HipA